MRHSTIGYRMLSGIVRHLDIVCRFLSVILLSVAEEEDGFVQS